MKPAPQTRTSGRDAVRLAIFLAVVFAIKLTVIWQLKDHILMQPIAILDSAAYLALAREVMSGHLALGPKLYYVSPFYIYFLAAALKIGGSLTFVRVLQIALGTLSVGAVFLTAREWFNQRAAWLAATLAALTGLFSFYETVIFQSSVDTALTSAALLCLTLALRRRGSFWFFLSGLVFGIQSLNRPNLLLAAAAIALLLLALRRWTPAALITIGIVIGLAPVGIRNVVVSHQWSLVSSHGGLNFLIGNGEGASGLFRAIPGIRPTIEGQEFDSRIVAERALNRTLTDSEVSAYFSNQAWSWIRQHPADWAALLTKKLGYTLHAQHIALPLSYPFFAYDLATVLRFLAIGPWFLLPVGLFGLAVTPWTLPRERRADYLVWLSFIPLCAASIALFFAAERYRLPLLLPLTITAAAGVDVVLQWGQSRESKRVLAAAAGLLVLFALTNRPLNIFDGDARNEERVHFAENLAQRGKVAEAEWWLALALPDYPYPQSAQYRVSEQLAQAGQPAAAVNVLRAVRPSRDAGVETWLSLGRLAVQLRANDLAADFFGRASDAAPDSEAARAQHGAALLVLGRYRESASELTVALQLNPKNPDLLASLGYCDLQLHDIAQARAHTDAALALAPDHPLALQVRALLGGRDK